MGTKTIESLDKSKRLVIGKIVLQDQNGKNISSDVSSCFKFKNKKSNSCGIFFNDYVSRFNNLAANLRSIKENEMDYVFFETEPGAVVLTSLRFNNIGGGRSNIDLRLKKPLGFYVDPNYDATYFGTIYVVANSHSGMLGSVFIANNIIYKVSDEIPDVLDRLHFLNKTGRDIAYTKNLARTVESLNKNLAKQNLENKNEKLEKNYFNTNLKTITK